MVPPHLFSVLHLQALCLQLLLQDPNLGQRLLLRPLRLDTCLLLLPHQPILLLGQYLQVPPKHLCVPLDTSQVRFECLHGTCDAGLLGFDADVFFRGALELGGLVREGSAEVLDFKGLEIELVAAVVVGRLGGRMLFA